MGADACSRVKILQLGHFPVPLFRLHAENLAVLVKGVGVPLVPTTVVTTILWIMVEDHDVTRGIP
eukprot:9502491-Pyramimonas_sp.AAC.1